MTSGRHREAGWASASLRGNGHFNPHLLDRPCKETQGQLPVSEKASSVELILFLPEGEARSTGASQGL